MRKDFIVLVIAFGCARGAAAGDHLVGAGTVSSRVIQGLEERAKDVAIVSRALDSEEARRAADLLGTNLPAVQSALTHLSDADVRDLARRASRLRQDPAAGLSRGANEFLVIFLIVAIVILVLKAVG